MQYTYQIVTRNKPHHLIYTHRVIPIPSNLSLNKNNVMTSLLIQYVYIHAMTSLLAHNQSQYKFSSIKYYQQPNKY